MHVQRLTSKANPKIQHLRKLLSDRNYRYLHNEYVIEGVRALDRLQKTKELFVREGVTPPALSPSRVSVVGRDIFRHITDTEHSQGIVAVAPMALLDVRSLSKKSSYVLLDGLQDPGNMGSIIRTCCAFGVEGIIVTPGCVDPYSPKVVRAAAGALEKIKIIKISDIEELKGYDLIAADVQGEDAARFPWPGHFILCIGNEANGISEKTRRRAAHMVALPISECIESLNAAVAAGIIIYLARKQSG